MYNAEVLSKFPVVQHFPFGSLFVWERDPAAKQIQTSVHTASQPNSTAPTSRPEPPLRDPMGEAGTSAVGGGMPPMSGTAAPWASSRVPSRPSVPVPAGPNQPTRAPWASSTPLPPGGTTTAPWAKPGGTTAQSTRNAGPSTRAPWADRKT
jgi:serine/threonine-protein phosphatase 2A activator